VKIPAIMARGHFSGGRREALADEDGFKNIQLKQILTIYPL
jgi:hypothetical protein